MMADFKLPTVTDLASEYHFTMSALGLYPSVAALFQNGMSRSAGLAADSREHAGATREPPRAATSSRINSCFVYG
jgi:hypothetical protein